MNTYWLILILFLDFWVTAPISESCNRRLEKAKLVYSVEEIQNTGVSVTGYWIISILIFGIAKGVDFFIEPWGTNVIATLLLIAFVLAWVKLPMDIHDLRKIRKANSTRSHSEETGND